jgi:hypothetical protein
MNIDNFFFFRKNKKDYDNYFVYAFNFFLLILINLVINFSSKKLEILFNHENNIVYILYVFVLRDN